MKDPAYQVMLDIKAAAAGLGFEGIMKINQDKAGRVIVTARDDTPLCVVTHFNPIRVERI